jgi:alpha-1,2-mannosyltransferase
VVGSRILHGLSPYDTSWQHIANGVAFPYPATAGLMFVPFALVSRNAADWVYVLLCMGAAIGALRVLDVRDWRLYGFVFLLWPVISAWQAGNLTLPLAFGIALMWRYRDRPAVAGVLVAAIICTKPVVWPLGLWLLATRRYRALATALVSAAAISAVSWTVVGFGQIGSYTRVTDAVTAALDRTGYGVVAFAAHLGLGHAVGTVLAVALGACAAVVCFRYGRRGREVEALILSIVLMLVASPVVWNHYLALLIVPLALARPRLSAAWVASLVLWACPAISPRSWQVALAWIVTGGVVYVLCRRRPVEFAPHVVGARATRRVMASLNWVR